MASFQLKHVPLIPKIAILFVLLCCSSGRIKGAKASIEFKGFADFLQFNHLGHGIVVQHMPTATGIAALSGDQDMRSLVGNFRIHFLNVGTAARRHFNEPFYASSPRVGILLPQLDNERLRDELLANASSGDFFNNTQVWFIVADNSPRIWTNLSRIFNSLNINVNSDVTLAFKMNSSALVLYDIYKICHACGSPLEIEEKGFWSAQSGLVMQQRFLGSFVRRRRNFRNVTIKTATVLRNKPDNISDLAYLKNSLDNKHLDSMARKVYALISMMEPMLNLSLDITFLDNFGKHVNNTWTGILGVIVSHEVEFALCPMRVTTERMRAFHYPPSLHTEVLSLIFRHPRRNLIRNIFFEPLANVVWWSVLSLTALMVLLLAINVQQEYKQQQKQQHQHPPQHSQPVESRFDFIVLTVLEAILMQGPSPNLFRLISTRTLILTTGLFSFMLLQFYSAFIVSSLLADAPRSIVTPEAIYNSSLAIGLENVSYNFDSFANAKKQINRDIFTNRICADPRHNILPVEQGIERIIRGGFAFHMSEDRALRLLKAQLDESRFCELQEITLVRPFVTSIPSNKHTIYREFVAQAILHFRSTGLLQYNEKQWEVKKLDCKQIRQNKEVEVDMEHFLPALLFLAMLMLISTCVLALELAINWYQRRRQQRRGVRKIAQQDLRKPKF